MLMHLRYLLAVVRHKRFVYEAGRKLGLGRWQMLIHDWTKFTPRMWRPYAQAFYGSKARATGKPDDDLAFDRAWLWHQHMEPHHWQHWVLMEDSGRVHALEMPEKYLLEMCADWLGANKAYGDQPLGSWYEKSKPRRTLHQRTRERVEAILFGARYAGGIAPSTGLHERELLESSRRKARAGEPQTPEEAAYFAGRTRQYLTDKDRARADEVRAGYCGLTPEEFRAKYPGKLVTRP